MSRLKKKLGLRAVSNAITGRDIKPIDFYVAERIRQRREELGITQAELGLALGVSFQQIQKYEHATDRTAYSTLHDIATALDVPITYFDEGYEPKRQMRPNLKILATYAQKRAAELIR